MKGTLCASRNIKVANTPFSYEFIQDCTLEAEGPSNDL